MILYLTREELKHTVITNETCYYFSISVNNIKRVAVNSDRENLTISVEDKYIDFYCLLS